MERDPFSSHELTSLVARSRVWAPRRDRMKTENHMDAEYQVLELMLARECERLERLSGRQPFADSVSDFDSFPPDLGGESGGA